MQAWKQALTALPKRWCLKSVNSNMAIRPTMRAGQVDAIALSKTVTNLSP